MLKLLTKTGFTLLGILLIIGIFVSTVPICWASTTDTVDTVELSNLTFNGEPAGIVVPAKYGDFSLLEGYNFILAGQTVVYEKIDVQNKMGYMLMLLLKCPKALVLQVYNGKTETGEWWIYDNEGLPHEVTEAEADKIWLGRPHLSCSVKRNTSISHDLLLPVPHMRPISSYSLPGM